MMQHYQTGLGLVGYLFIGSAVVLLPSVMPAITAEFAAQGLSLAAIGLLFPAVAGGGILGNVLAGLGSDRLGHQRLIWVAALLLAVALGCTAQARLWVLFVLSFVLVSAAQSALSTGINTMIADANRGARARALNVLHGVYGAGAAISPLLLGYLLERGLWWRWALSGVGCLWLLYGMAAYRLAQRMPVATTRPTTQQWVWGLLRQGPFLALFLIGFIYNGVAVSLLGWIALITQQSAGFSTFLAVSLIAVFYVALTIGRFGCALFAERLGYATTLLLLAGGITLTYPLIVLGLDSALVVSGVFLTGLSLSGLFPTILAYGARHYPAQAGTISGTLSVALTLGSMIPPLWTGAIGEIWGFQIAFGVNYLLVLPLVGLAFYLGRVETCP